MDGQMYGDVLTILGEGGYYDPLINAYYAFLAWKVSPGILMPILHERLAALGTSWQLSNENRSTNFVISIFVNSEASILSFWLLYCMATKSRS